MAAHTAVGYLLAVGFAGAAARASGSAPALLGLVLWVVCLNGGTLALNSAFDRDEGDIAYLRRPPPPPRHLAGVQRRPDGRSARSSRFGSPRRTRCAYAVCFVLSLAYSVPPLRLKAVAGADWIINMWGFGTLTPLCRMGRDRPAARCRARSRAARLLPALRGALPAHPALPARGGRPPRRSHARLRARHRARSLTAAIVAAAARVRAVRRGGSRAPGWRLAGDDLGAGPGSPSALACVGRGAAALAAHRCAGWRRPITSAACIGRSAPGRSPTWSSCSAGAPDGPWPRPRPLRILRHLSPFPETACTRQWNCARTTT